MIEQESQKKLKLSPLNYIKKAFRGNEWKDFFKRLNITCSSFKLQYNEDNLFIEVLWNKDQHNIN